MKEQGTVTAIAVNDPEQLQSLDTQRAAKEDIGEQWWQPVD